MGRLKTNSIILAALAAALVSSYLWSKDDGLSRSRPPRRMDLPRAQTPDVLSVTDGLGRRVAVKTPVKRIVSGYTAFAEILDALGATDRIVGATTQDADRLNVKSIGSHIKPDIEALVACKPELVLLSSRRPAVVTEMEADISRTGAIVFPVHPVTVDEALSLVGLLGDLTGLENEADKIIAAASAQLRAVDERIRAVPEAGRPKVFLEVRSGLSLLTCGRDSVAFDVIRRAGGRPVCRMPGTVVRVDTEAVVDGKPDWYIQQLGVMNRKPIELPGHPVLGELSCVKEGRHARIEEALLSRPGPRVAQAVARIHEILYADGGKL